MVASPPAPRAPSAGTGLIAQLARSLSGTGWTVAHIGCDGGDDARAWIAAGASSITGIDISAGAALRTVAGLPQLRILGGAAAATGLPGRAFDLVFARGLVARLPVLAPAAQEAARLLRPGGTLFWLDKTAEDVAAERPPGATLAGMALPDRDAVLAYLDDAGFRGARCFRLWQARDLPGAARDSWTVWTATAA